MQREQDTNVRQYFEEIARKFDSYYREDADTGGIVGKVAHAVFRRPGMARRFEATFSFLGDLRDRRILEIGCGSGIYSIEVARRGGYATGIDVSPKMIALAGENAAAAGCAERCSFLVKDLGALDPAEEMYDAVIAIGLFDYIPPADQRPALERMLSVSRRDVIATFPKRWVPGALLREIWFMSKELEVYFVTGSHVRGLVDPGRADVTFDNCGQIWTIRFRKK
jgi:magnesium-protoporphyrin O-methyltransferase